MSSLMAFSIYREKGCIYSCLCAQFDVSVNCPSSHFSKTCLVTQFESDFHMVVDLYWAKKRSTIKPEKSKKKEDNWNSNGVMGMVPSK